MIVIEKNTSIDDIDKSWIAEHSEIHFVLKADSSFQIFAEAYAIAVLRQLKEENIFIKVIIPDSAVINQLIDGKAEIGEHPLFSIFGLQLIYASSMISLQSNEVKNIREALAGTIWNYLVSVKMTIGDGKRVQYVSNHMHPVPLAFGGERKIKRYADYQKFKADISRRIMDVWKDGDGISEYHLDKITGIAFHASENAYDHGRSNYDKKIRGYYGVTIEKLFFENDEQIKERNNLPLLLRNYLLENSNSLNLGGDRKMRVQILSVSDLGNGIQNTLKLDETLTSHDLINKSFDDLVTSKPQNIDDEQPGFGLGDIVSLSRELKSLIYLQSGEHELYYDFSDEPESLTIEQKRKVRLIDLGERNKKYGLNLSLVWIVQSDKSQATLF